MTRLVVALFALFLSVAPALSQQSGQPVFFDMLEAWGDPDGYRARLLEEYDTPELAFAAMFARSGVTTACLQSPAARAGFECPGVGRFSASWSVHMASFFHAMNRALLGTHPENSTPGAACLSCHFIGEMATAMFTFAGASFLFFWSAFVFIAPVLIALWLTVRAIGLFASGGQNGQMFARGLSQKLALFGFMWAVMVAPGSTPGSSWAFETSGPGFVFYSFSMAADLRAHTLAALDGGQASAPASDEDAAAAGEFGPLGCDVVGQMPHLLNRPHAATVVEVVALACAVERFHVIGFGLAGWLALDGLVKVGWFFDPLRWDSMKTRHSNIFQGSNQAMLGLFMFVIFARSFIWLLFQILDVIVRITITAALLPAFALAGLFEQTRGMAKRGAESFAAAFVQCVSLSLVIGLFFHLFTFTPAVYEATRNVYAYVHELDEPLLPLVTSGTVPQFSEFMFRVNIDPNSWFADTSQHIPFGFSTPWLIYMLLCALALVSLGRKVMAVSADLFKLVFQAGTTLADAGVELLKEGTDKTTAAAKLGGAVAVVVASRMRIAQAAPAKNPFGRRSGGSMNPMSKGMKP